MKKIYLIILAVLLLAGIFQHKVWAQSWFNGIDKYDTTVNWLNMKNIDSIGAYSQYLFAVSTPLQPYGLGIENNFPDNIKGKNTIVIISGFVKIPDSILSGIYVFTLEKDGKTVYWQGVDLSKVVKDHRHWFRFNDSILVPSNITRSGKIKAYLWNNKKRGNIYIDDLQFDFVALKNPSFLPKLKNFKINSFENHASKVLYKNIFYTINLSVFDTSIIISNIMNKPLIFPILYYIKRLWNNDTVQIIQKWHYISKKIKNGKTELIFTIHNNLSKAILKITCTNNNPEIHFAISEKYKRKQLVLRNSLILQSKSAINEVFRSNRQSDNSDFQNEYWLDKEGVYFGKGDSSWFIYHCEGISSLQLDSKHLRLIINLDYAKDHPFMRFPLQPDSTNWKVDLSNSRYRRGDKTYNNFTITTGIDATPLPRLMKNPYGYQASYIWTEHADFSDIKTNRAVYFGNENITDPNKATGGFVKYNIPITKSVFYDNPDSTNNITDSNGSFTGLECSIMDDTAFRNFLFKIKKFKTEICLHTPEQYTTTRPRLKKALAYMQQHFGSKTWIDHGDNNGLENNREDLICDGTLKNSPYYAMDLWKKYGIKYFNDAYYEEMNTFGKWQFASTIEKPYRGFGDFLPKPDYWQHPTRTDNIYHWPNTKVLYVKNYNMWQYLFNKVQFSLFIENWGLEINHCYPARVNEKKGFWEYNTNGEIVSAKGFDKTLATMKQLHDKGLLYLSTLQNYLNYRIAIGKIHYSFLPYGIIKITNRSNTDLKGLSFAVKAKAVLVNGIKPEEKKIDDGLIFWFNLKKDNSAILRFVK